MRQKGILLSAVEAMDFINKKNGTTARGAGRTGLGKDIAQVTDTGQHR